MLTSSAAGPGGVKLQALETLLVRNESSRADLSFSASGYAPDEQYKLDPITDRRCEIILLRPGDVITSPDASSSVSYVWVAPEVQVNSSATNARQAESSMTKNQIDETPEEETEKEEKAAVTEVPVTQPVTQPTKSQLSATPHLPKDRSMVVHETPTANRILERDDFNVAPSNEAHHIEATSPLPGVIPITETFSTARTARSPNVELGTDQKRPHSSTEVRVGNRRRKRQDPELSPSLEVTPAADEPLSKRTKAINTLEEEEGNIRQAGPFDNTNANPGRMTYSAKAKRRTTTNSEATPTKSSRSSQRSATATTVAAYEGPSPRVAISNSSIKEDSPMVRFLRKQGGVLINNVEDNCNVLW